MKGALRSLAIAAAFCAAATQTYATNEQHEKNEQRERDEERERDDRHGRRHPHGIACSVSAVSLAFGNYNPLRGGHSDTTGNIAVTCSGRSGAKVAYSIALNAGGSGTFAQRRMRFGSTAVLNYNIYTGATRSVVWGDGSAGTLVVSDSFRFHAPKVHRNYPVYGRIFGGQNPRVGFYADSIVVTLDF